MDKEDCDEKLLDNSIVWFSILLTSLLVNQIVQKTPAWDIDWIDINDQTSDFPTFESLKISWYIFS